jgi:ankyrin repeat protein
MAKAVDDQHEDNIRHYYNEGADLNAQDSVGLTLLQNAVNDGKIVSARVLLELGADPDIASGPSHWTALHYAAYRCNRAMADLLLEHRADPNAPNHHARRPLHTAAFSGDLDVSIALVKAGADAKARDDDGHTAFDIATLRAEERFQFAQKPFVEVAVYLKKVMGADAERQEQLAQDIEALKSHHPERYKLKPRQG